MERAGREGMMIDYPVKATKNWEIIDSSGRRVCSLWDRRRTESEMEECGEWLAGLINASVASEAVESIDFGKEVSGVDISNVEPDPVVPVAVKKRRGNPAWVKGMKRVTSLKK